MSEVARLTNMNNGYGLVKVSSDRKAVHEGGRRDVKNFTIDESISGRKVVLFEKPADSREQAGIINTKCN